MKWSESCCVMSNSLWSHGLYSPWDPPGQNTRVGSLSLLQGNFPYPGIEPRSPALQADSLPAKPQQKPKNTGMGSLSLLQGIFLTQELNRDLLHCRQILYQLSYEGSPSPIKSCLKAGIILGLLQGLTGQVLAYWEAFAIPANPVLSVVVLLVVSEF